MRWAHAIAALAMAGCLGDDELEEGAAEQESVLATTARLPRTLRSCFVLDDASPVTTAELDTIRSNVNDWGHADSGLRFEWQPSTFVSTTIGGATYSTNCTRNKLGNFTQQLRLYVDTHDYSAGSAVQLPATLKIPGCNLDEGLGSQAEDENGNPIQLPNGRWQIEWGYMWSQFADQILANPTCLYTTHLVRGAARNNNEHEVGHALGLAHEQIHSDQNCQANLPSGGIKLTTYDRDSVMHYVMNCTDGTTTVGNWGSTGPSASDKLAMELMYPPTSMARINGSTVHWQPWMLSARSNWVMRGAYVWGPAQDNALRNFVWRIDGAPISSRLEPAWWEWWYVPVGSHVLTLEYSDLWGQAYSGSTIVEVMPSQQAYNARVASAATVF